MGFLDGLMGNASEVNVNDIRSEYSMLLSKAETIEKAYKLMRDVFIFTDKRLILVDKQGKDI
ncbi:PH domain-containing protein [bacterium BFN5]|nr:PH domain-containing protein [bacterium BFN5]